MSGTKKRVKASDHELNKKQRTSLIGSSKGTLTEKHGWDKKAVNKRTGKKTETMIVDSDNPLSVTRADHLALNVVRPTKRVYSKDNPKRINPLTGETIKKDDPVPMEGKVAIDSDDLEGFLEGHEREVLRSPKISAREKESIARRAANRQETSIVESKTLTRKKPMRVQRLEEEAERKRKEQKVEEKKIEEVENHQVGKETINKRRKELKPFSECSHCGHVTGFDEAGDKCYACDVGRFEGMTEGDLDDKFFLEKGEELKNKPVEIITPEIKKEEIDYYYYDKEEHEYYVLHLITDNPEEAKKETNRWKDGKIVEKNGVFEVWGSAMNPGNQTTKRRVNGVETFFKEGKEQKVEKKEIEIAKPEETLQAERKERILRKIKEEQKRPYSPEEEEAIKLAILERYPGLDEEDFNFGKGQNGMVNVRFNESGKFSTTELWKKSLLDEGKELKAETKEPRLVEATINDIDAEKASRAYHGTSFSPEQRGLSDRRAYAAHVNAFYDDLYSQVSEDQRDELVKEMVKYKAFYKKQTEEQLYRHSGLASTMIAGGSNFPARQMNKKSDMYDKKRNEFFEKDAKVQRAIKKRLGLIKPRGISSDDPDAIEQIDAKIAMVEKDRNRMKGSNKIIRSKKFTPEEKIAKLQELGYPEDQAKIIQKEERIVGGVWITSKTTEIRRLKERKTHLEKQRQDTTTTTIMNGIEVEDNVEENRLRILFGEKPDPETIRDLKSSGFRWSPRNTAWQRYRSNAANYEAERITKKYSERSVPKKEKGASLTIGERRERIKKFEKEFNKELPTHPQQVKDYDNALIKLEQFEKKELSEDEKKFLENYKKDIDTLKAEKTLGQKIQGKYSRGIGPIQEEEMKVVDPATGKKLDFIGNASADFDYETYKNTPDSWKSKWRKVAQWDGKSWKIGQQNREEAEKLLHEL